MAINLIRSTGSAGTTVSFSFLFIAFLLTGCVSVEEPSPVQAVNERDVTITPVNQFPERLPKGLSRFEDSPFVFVHADHASTFAAGLVVPVPFVTDAVVNKINHDKDRERNRHYLTLDAYQQFLEKMKTHNHFRPMGGDYSLYMLIPIEECVDSVYRISLLFQLEKGDWLGRYYYHLPTPVPKQDIANPTPEELRIFSQELGDGIDTLMDVIENEIAENYPGDEKPVTVGSLYIVGGQIAGLMSPEIFKIKNAIQIAETDDAVIIRIPGDPKGQANNGGMAFGVHYFLREQLHTYELQDPQ